MKRRAVPVAAAAGDERRELVIGARNPVANALQLVAHFALQFCEAREVRARGYWCGGRVGSEGIGAHLMHVGFPHVQSENFTNGNACI